MHKNVYDKIMLIAYMCERLLVSLRINAIYITTGMQHSAVDVHRTSKLVGNLLILRIYRFSDALFAKDGFLFHKKFVFIRINILS
jgi:hypothetical protein